MQPGDESGTLQGAQTPPSWVRLIGWGVMCIVAAHLLDRPVWQHIRDLGVNDRDWGRMLRSLGYLPVWGSIALGVFLHDRRTGMGAARGRLLLLAPVLSGLVAELLKLLVRRLRPDAETFGYAFRAFTDRPLSNGGMGMPSSHAMVAVAGAVVLGRYFPESRWLWYALAAGCALTRVLSVAHFFSDTVTGAVLAVMVALALMQRFPVRR